MYMFLLSALEITINSFSFTAETVLLAAAFLILIFASVCDIKSQTVPDIFPVLLLAAGITSAVVVPVPALSSRLIGLFIVSAPLFLISMVTDGFGGADIKLASVCGLILGAKNIVLAFFIAIILAAIFGSAYVYARKVKLKTRIPFVPFISAGVIVAAIFGDRLIAWYLGLF